MKWEEFEQDEEKKVGLERRGVSVEKEREQEERIEKCGEEREVEEQDVDIIEFKEEDDKSLSFAIKTSRIHL